MLYLDTCIEPWPGGYTDPNLSPSERSNYALREQALALRQRYPSGPTAVITHGANPGLVSHFVKQALVDLAREADPAATVPADRAGWARLAERLGVKIVHIAERDTQVATIPKSPGEFVNTWSIDGFFSEGSQAGRARLGHPRAAPSGGRATSRFRQRGGHLPAAAGSRHAGTQLDAARRTLSRLPRHP